MPSAGNVLGIGRRRESGSVCPAVSRLLSCGCRDRLFRCTHAVCRTAGAVRFFPATRPGRVLRCRNIRRSPGRRPRPTFRYDRNRSERCCPVVIHEGERRAGDVVGNAELRAYFAYQGGFPCTHRAEEGDYPAAAAGGYDRFGGLRQFAERTDCKLFHIRVFVCTDRG